MHTVNSLRSLGMGLFFFFFFYDSENTGCLFLVGEVYHNAVLRFRAVGKSSLAVSPFSHMHSLSV